MIQKTNKIIISEEESKICKIDNRKFDSNRKMIWYVRKNYNLSFEEYIVKCYYNDTRPTCLKTGNSLSFKSHKLGPWFSDYSKNIFLRKCHTIETKQKIKIGCEKTSMVKFGVKNVFESEWCKEKIKSTNFERYGVDNPSKNKQQKLKTLNTFLRNKKLSKQIDYSIVDIDKSKKYNPTKQPSSLENLFENFLISSNITYIHPFMLDGKKFDFYIHDMDSIIEIDGFAFHRDKLENLTLSTINGSVNDYEKNIICEKFNKKLYRVRYDGEPFSTLSNLRSLLVMLEYVPNYSLSTDQVICKKEYFKNFIYINGVDDLRKKSYMFLKFIRKFQKDFPYTNNIDDEKINESLIKCWYDDEYMKEVIEQQIGCNNTNEIFDFSINQLVYGMLDVIHTDTKNKKPTSNRGGFFG